MCSLKKGWVFFYFCGLLFYAVMFAGCYVNMNTDLIKPETLARFVYLFNALEGGAKSRGLGKEEKINQGLDSSILLFFIIEFIGLSLVNKMI